MADSFKEWLDKNFESLFHEFTSIYLDGKVLDGAEMELVKE